MTLMALLVPGVVGGLLLAAFMARLNRRPSSGLVSRTRLEPMSPDLINMAHIRVTGIGGLGMLGAAVVTAYSVPEIGVALAVGAGFGVAIAIGLVAYRDRLHAADPGGQDGRPPSVLALDDRAARAGQRPPRDVPGAPLAATA